ncbi:MAG: hypothetical protein ACK520_15670, partial [Inhella sp.]
VTQDFAQQHLADQRLPPEQRRPYTLVIAVRSWLFGPFAALRRDAAAPARAEPAVPQEPPSPLPR